MMYTKADTKFDDLSKVFAKLNNDDQDKVVKLVRSLSKTQTEVKKASKQPPSSGEKR